jgi:tRNA (guanine-N(7)-)-methyltransferase subunit TRM82
MPKRLCAIVLTRNQNTILAGDKFGDVYALPLHQSSDSKAIPSAKPQLEIPKPFKPSASELTVHTKGNREALRQQQLQKAAASRKQEPNFEHELILGHVSTLTDLVVGIDASNSNRECVLTADRDEHIRISRGIPQAHIINNYCLGHTDFVSRLCMVPEQPQFLISGDGEPSLRIFDWLQGTIVAQAKVDQELRRLVTNSAFSYPPKPNEKRAISCTRALHVEDNGDREEVIITMVALEG